MRHVTTRGLDRIILHEGIRLSAYRDVAGFLTIGVGHLLTRSELSSGKVSVLGQAVRWGDGITEQQAQALLRQDLAKAERVVDDQAPGLKEAQFDALVSLVFNIGIGAFLSSTLLKRIKTRDLADVPAQIKRWNRAGGVVVAGLKNRREAEASLWASA